MEDKTTLTLDRIYQEKEFDAKSFGPARWLKDESGYTTVEKTPELEEEKTADGSETSEKTPVREIIRYEIQSGERSVLVPAAQLQPEGAEKPLAIKNYEWSDDKEKLLIFTNTKRVWRQHTRGDYWVLTMDSGELSQLGGDAQPSTLMFAKFSPDGHSVAYVRENNIYVESLASGEIVQLTADGGKEIVNGTSDWVYEEEFHLRDGFSWSPDGDYIAYWQFDVSGIKPFYMINNTDSLYPKLIPLPYPKVGTTNAACRVGVVSTAGGETVWFDVPGEPRDHYIPKMSWAKNGDADSPQVVIQQLNRLQNRNKVLLGNVDGSTERVFTEEDEAWIDIHDDLKWLDDGASFTWVSDRDGWRHIYRISKDGQEVTLLTPGAFDVISVQLVDKDGGWVYFIASPDNPTQRYLYRSDLNGDGRTERLSPLDMPGTHSYQISPGGEWAFHTYQNFETPPVISLISLPEHQRVRVLEDNQELRDKVDALTKAPIEFFRQSFTEEDGAGVEVQLDGWFMKPPDFDPQKKYPLLFFVYGECAGQTVLDRWGEKSYLWHVLMTQQGYLVVSMDNRGTPSPRGRQWLKGVYRQLGILTTADQAAAARAFIDSHDFVAAERVGVWGWSGGGSMTLNLMFRHPDIYQTGIAIAAVSDMRYYDTIYQERYMGLPDDNEEGFKNGSPITFAEGLEGNLLLIHGTGDDNVHYQCFEVLVNKLIALNKKFSMMSYPNRSHAIREGKNTSRHLYSLMADYLQENL